MGPLDPVVDLIQAGFNGQFPRSELRRSLDLPVAGTDVPAPAATSALKAADAGRGGGKGRKGILQGGGYYFALSRHPGCPWFVNSTPALSKASITALIVSSPLPSVAAPFPSMAEIVVTFTPAWPASWLWLSPAKARAAFN
jgi:hypothetical protein